jgi:ribose transport system substrate-binding protein
MMRQANMLFQTKEERGMNRRLGMIVIALAALVAVVTMPLTAAGKTTFKIGYSQCLGKNPFLIAMTNGAKKAISEWEAKGYKIDLVVTDAGDVDMSKQVSDVEDIFAMHVDGLLIFPAAGSKLMSDPIRNIYNKNNIPVVVTDIGLTNAKWASFIITDNNLGGKMCARLVAASVPKGAKVVTFDVNPAAENVQARVRGFESEAKLLGLTVLPEKTLPLTLEDGRRLTEDTLTSIPDLAAIFYTSQIAAQGGVAALTAVGNKTCKVVGFDIDAPSLQMIKDGKVLGLAVQDPFNIGYAGMNQMMAALTGAPTKDSVNIPPLLATAKNATEFDNNPQVKQ